MSGFFSASELGHGTSGGSLLKRIAVGLALVGGCTTSVLAAAISWNNPAGGNWSTAANWSPASVPGVADDAIITLNGTYTVTQDVAVSVNSLTLGGCPRLEMRYERNSASFAFTRTRPCRSQRFSIILSG